MSDGKKTRMTYYPGCSSQGSGRHLDESLRAILPEVDDIEDWNCCGASVGHIGGGALPNMHFPSPPRRRGAVQADHRSEVCAQSSTCLDPRLRGDDVGEGDARF